MSDDTRYAGQSRGSGAAYERYLAGMDASMRQKVALTAAHLLCEGTVADMGMGSGATSMALAALYPMLDVVGVDVNPEMVARASHKHRAPNLSFIVGDIAKRCFPDEALQAIVNSSVLHHVTTFNGYSTQAAVDAMSAQATQLADDGILIVRDFVRPEPKDEGAGDTVTLELPAKSGELLRRLASEFRPLSDAPGFPLQSLGPCDDGWERFELSRRHAVEFILRKDYVHDWDIEVLEEYTYLTQAGFEQAFADLGLRVLSSTPLFNPWIVQHRFEGQFRWFDADGALDWPATNYVIVGQKVPPAHGVRFEPFQSLPTADYLTLSHWRRDDGAVFDLVRRPGHTADVIPWFVEPETGSIHVLARRSYPRPIMALAETCVPDGARAPHYVTEPMTIVVDDTPLAQAAEARLSEFPDLDADNLLRFELGATFYPSPGGLQEAVRPLYVEVAPTLRQSSLHARAPWSSWGSLRAMEGRQLLRTAQVGGLPDARLEMHVYDLLLRRGAPVGPWIGSEIPLCTLSEPSASDALSDVANRVAPDSRPKRRRFRRLNPSDKAVAAEPRFLNLRRIGFRECAGNNDTVGEGALEFVSPGPVSTVTVSLALLAQASDGRLFFAIDDDDLPAAQCFTGHSDLWVTPAWRCPTSPHGWRGLTTFVRDAAVRDYGLAVGTLVPLGGRYFPSPGCTPEVVYPLLGTLLLEPGSHAAADAATTRLRWQPLEALVSSREQLSDGHLRISVLRAAHAMGLLTQAAAQP